MTKSSKSIINKKQIGLFSPVIYLFLLLNCFSLFNYAQKVALITPEKNENTDEISEIFNNNLKLIDSDLVKTAYQSQSFETPFNLTADESRNLANVIGCDYFMLLKSENLRRTSLSKPTYFESYVTVYLVSGKSGQLVFWTLKSFEHENADSAQNQLFNSISNLTREIINQVQTAKHKELIINPRPPIEELPSENSPESIGFVSPLPFKRYIPVYKRIANLYGIAATVDALVDLDEKGRIINIEIVRWAGYDLDQSVIENINRMQWTPASRNGKTLPIRVLLRYNFKKIEKEDEN